MGKENLSWRYVFNTELKHHGHNQLAASEAIRNGYQYMSWSGRVYKINKDSEYNFFEEIGLIDEVMI